MNGIASSKIHIMFDETAKQYPQRLAITEIFEGSEKTYTYRDLQEKVAEAKQQLASAFSSVSTNGQRVVILGPNTFEFVAMCFALLSYDVTLVPMDPKIPESEMHKLIAMTDPMLILAYDKTLRETLGKKFSNTYSWTDLFAAGKPLIPIESKNPTHNVDFFIFTSGTTSAPKAVMLTHESAITVLRGIWKNYRSGDVVPVIVPNFHVSGLFMGIFGSLTASHSVSPGSGGHHLIFSDNITKHLSKIFVDYRPTILPGVPELWSVLRTKIESQMNGSFKKRLLTTLIFLSFAVKFVTKINIGRTLFARVHKSFGGRLRIMFSGGAHLTSKDQRFFEGLGFGMLNAYGLTETSGACLSQTFYQRRMNGSLGKAIVGEVSIRLVPSPQDEKFCELQIKGPAVMKGYFSDQESTKLVLKDGWFNTGDFVRKSISGHFYVVGRGKEMIVLPNGKKISLSHVDTYFLNIPGIEKIAAFAIRNPITSRDELHLAVLIDKNRRASLPPDANTIFAKDSVYERAKTLANHFFPTDVHIVANIPLTATKKPKRHEIVNIISDLNRTNQKKSEKQPLPSDERNHVEREVKKAIVDALQLVSGGGIDRSESIWGKSFVQLGIDSLTSLNFMEELGKSGPIPDAHTWHDMKNLAEFADATVALRHGQSKSEILDSARSTAPDFYEPTIAEKTNAQIKNYILYRQFRIENHSTDEIVSAFKKLVASHPGLRVMFPRTHAGIYAVIMHEDHFILRMTKYSEMTEEQFRRNIDRLHDDEPIDLTRDPGFQVYLYAGKESHIAAVRVHHAFFDAWSAGVLFQDLSDLLEKKEISKRFSCRAASTWINQQVQQPNKNVDLFLEDLSGKTFFFPTDFSKTPSRYLSSEHASVPIDFSALPASQVSAAIHLAWIIAQSVCTDVSEIVTWVSVHGRVKPDWKQYIGRLHNLIPISYRISENEDTSLKSALQDVEKMLQHILSIQFYQTPIVAEKLLPHVPNLRGLTPQYLEIANTSIVLHMENQLARKTKNIEALGSFVQYSDLIALEVGRDAHGFSFQLLYDPKRLSKDRAKQLVELTKLSTAYIFGNPEGKLRWALEEAKQSACPFPDLPSILF